MANPDQQGMDAMPLTVKKSALSNQRKHRRKSRKNSPLVPKGRLNKTRLERKLERTKLNTVGLILLGLLVFGVTYFASGWVAPFPSPSIALEEFDELNQLSNQVGLILEEDERVKNRKIQEILDSGENSATQLLYRDRSVKLTKKGEPEIRGESIFKVIDRDHLQFMVPVGVDDVQGLILARKNIQHHDQTVLWSRLLISAGVALILVSILMQFRTSLITRQVDILCRQFMRYRREHETRELDMPESLSARTGIELRIMTLKELWTRFQKNHEDLGRNVKELETSKEILEQTVDYLKRAKEQEQRLVELGYAIAEFGHDIGNANGSILSFSTLVLKMLEKDPVHSMDLVRSLTFIRRIKQSSINISGLTGDILEFAKGKVELHQENISFESFREQLDAQLGFVGETPLEYTIPAGYETSVIHFDYRKICRVVVNLVKNSWEKLQDEEDDVQIRIGMKVMNGQDLRIQVFDNGAPIPDSILNHLFESFQTEGKTQGTGLGLAISKKLVDLHGGAIRGRNLPKDGGVIFEIDLPGCILHPRKSGEVSGTAELDHTEGPEMLPKLLPDQAHIPARAATA